jgi:hypothetical protein
VIKVALETDIFLSDFFFRNPSFMRAPANQEEADEVNNRLQQVQDLLDTIANAEHVHIFTSIPAFCRFAGILTDLKVNADQIKEELEYICTNAGLLQVDIEGIEHVMNRHEHPFQFETWLWENLAEKHQLNALITAKTINSSTLTIIKPGASFPF